MGHIREPFNTWSHFAGGVVVILGAIALCIAYRSDPLAIAGFIVFGVGAGFLYASSTAYHWTPRIKKGLQKMDHSAIFVMIAASYTPVCFLALPSPQNWIVLGLQWALCLFGVLMTTLLKEPPNWMRLVLYVTMGWMVLPLTPQIAALAGPIALGLMVAGGIVYSVGIGFYASRKPILWPGVFSNHEVWHLFVIGGTICHYAMMWCLPRS